MCLKYNIGLLNTYSKDAIYHTLAKTLKFSTTKMQYTEDDQKDLIWVLMWAKKGLEKGVDKCIWDNVQLLS